MKHVYTLLAVLLPLGLFAQTANVRHEKCLAHHYYEEMMDSDPQFRASQIQLEAETESYVDQYMAERQSSTNRNASVVRVIPVVFHVIHEGGPENISRTQIVDQIDSLNVDFRRLNFDATNTPAVFQPLGGDAEIEFRLATLDPNGNCTDGVVRVYSTLTNEARNNVKALSYWPSNQYLNIWVVKTIENTSGSSGIILGFAQFPGGSAATDGVVMRHDVVGSIGTASGTFNNNGRTATHEIGHWLNLRHIWGDANCGSDFVADTPTQQDDNAGCPSWPLLSNCTGNAPNGDMYSNYMDYTDGACQNIFSTGQCARMNAALSSGTSGRNNLWSANNLIATGTDGTPGAVCVPVAAFTNNLRMICEGTTVNFTDGSWNSAVTSWLWDFPGGTPSSSTAQNPSVVYNTAGIYDVTLTVTNSAGTNSYTDVASVTVVPAIGQNAIPYSEGFETTAFPGTDWPVINEGGNTWTLNTNVAHTGTNSVFIYNYTGNTTQTHDEFITPTYNLSNVTNANLSFWLAFAARSNSSVDQLRVFASTTCGQIWNIRYNKTGLTLSTAGLITTNFIPTAAQWRQETVNIASSSYNNKPNVRFKFDYYQGNGNNIYIDDLNLNGTVGIDEVMEESLDLNIYPNPAQGAAYIEFHLDDNMHVNIDVLDVLGRAVNSVADVQLEAGDYRFELPAGLASGLYTVRLNADGFITSQKVLVGK
jgi:PKD repeat protein